MVLKRNKMVHGDRPLLSIGYKYKSLKVLYLVVTQGTQRTKDDTPHLSKYPDHFSNVSIQTVSHSHIIDTLFGYVNEIFSHNKSRQSDLALENLCVSQYGCLWICTIFSIGINVTL